MWKVNENKLLLCKLDGMESPPRSNFPLPPRHQYFLLDSQENQNFQNIFYLPRTLSLFNKSVQNKLHLFFASVLTVIQFGTLGAKECFWLKSLVKLFLIVLSLNTCQ